MFSIGLVGGIKVMVLDLAAKVMVKNLMNAVGIRVRIGPGLDYPWLPLITPGLS